jgi:fibronectin-binding autotransporter adhesin
MMKKNFGSFSVFIFTVFAFGVIFAFWGTPITQAADFTVVDTVADGNSGSLRDAIEHANATAEVDTILLQPGRYILNLGELEIEQDLVIKGSGAGRTIIDGNGNDRVFSMTTAVKPDLGVRIIGLTITGGFLQNRQGSVYGGGIYNEGNLILSGSTVIGNIAECATDGLYSGYAFGGGICSFGTSANLTLIGSEVTGNQALSDFDEAGSYGGGIYSEGTLTIKRSKIDQNMVDSGEWAAGGGVCIGADNVKFTLMGSQITSNSADASWWAEGSGLSIHGDNAVLALVNSHISENMLYSDTAQGGGISIYSDNVLLKLNRSQVTKNTISGYDAFGGGISNSSNNSEIRLAGSSVSGNSVRGYNDAFGGGISNSWGESKLVLKNSHVNSNELTGDLVASGGGIYWYGDLTVQRSQIVANRVESLSNYQGDSGAAMYGARGGGIYSNGNNRFNLSGSRVTKNTVSSSNVQEGGGVWVGATISYARIRSVVRNNQPDQVFIESGD